MTPVKYVIPLPPISKKNHQEIMRNKKTGKPFIMPSRQYRKYEEVAALYLRPRPKNPIDCPVNVKCLFYMDTMRRVDKSNLEEAAHDVLVAAGILEDDNRDIIAGSDGTRVLYDKENPRTEITITPMEGYEQWAKRKK